MIKFKMLTKGKKRPKENFIVEQKYGKIKKLVIFSIELNNWVIRTNTANPQKSTTRPSVKPNGNRGGIYQIYLQATGSTRFSPKI